VLSFTSEAVYDRLMRIWEAKECHAIKLLVSDMGSPAGTIAVVMTRLLSCNVIRHLSFVRCGRRNPAGHASRVPVVVGFTTAATMCAALQLIAQTPRPRQVRSDTWTCTSCSAKCGPPRATVRENNFLL
jgi:hypothetical protein